MGGKGPPGQWFILTHYLLPLESVLLGSCISISHGAALWFNPFPRLSFAHRAILSAVIFKP
jgi:hypothetical protein